MPMICLFFFADEPFSAKRIGVIPDLSSLRNSNEVNDDSGEENEEGSGINPGPDPTKDAVKDIVESVRKANNYLNDKRMGVKFGKLSGTIYIPR